MDKDDHIFEIADSHGDTLSFCSDQSEKHGTRLNFFLTEDYGHLGSEHPRAVIFLDLVQSRKLALAILAKVDQLEGVKHGI